MLSAELAEDMTTARSRGAPVQQATRRVHMKCMHGRALARCVTCGGTLKASIKCTAHKERYCAECGITQLKKQIVKRCIHDKILARCIECGGTPQIHHRCIDHSKFNCVECGAAPLKRCSHGSTSGKCVECSGCPHRKRKDHCVKCSGCVHGQRKYTCIPCKGNGICEHQVVRQYCIDCNGVSICEHKRKRMYCFECKGSRLCSSCYMSSVHVTGDLCRACQPMALKNARVKESSVAGHLKEWSEQLKIPIYAFWNKQVKGSNTTVCGAMRPDFTWELATHIVVLEVDEDQHSFYPAKCEFQRMCNLSGSFGMPMVMIWYNPDAFKISEETKRTNKTTRLPLLLERLQHALTTPPSVLITVEYLYYSRIPECIDWDFQLFRPFFEMTCNT